MKQFNRNFPGKRVLKEILLSGWIGVITVLLIPTTVTGRNQIARDGFNGTCELLYTPANKPTGSLFFSSVTNPLPFTWYEGTDALQLPYYKNNQGIITYESIAMDTRLYKEIECSFRIGCQGVDKGDYLDIYINRSRDADTKVLRITGYSNAHCSFDGPASLTVDYLEIGKDNFPVADRPVSSVTIRNLPATENWIFKIKSKTDATGEFWAIDHLAITGSLRVLTPELISSETLSQERNIVLQGSWTKPDVERFNALLGETRHTLRQVTLQSCQFMPDASPAGLFAGCKVLTSVEVAADAEGVGEEFHDINPNCLIYLPEGVVKGNRTNVVYGSQATRIELADGYPFYCPRSFTADTIRYERWFSADKQSGHPDLSAGWETLCLPFEAAHIVASDKEHVPLKPFGSEIFNPASGFNPFWLRILTPAGYQNTERLQANTPYLICMPNHDRYDACWNISGTVCFSAGNAAVLASANTLSPADHRHTMYSAFGSERVPEGMLILNADGTAFESFPVAEVNPFGCYVKTDDSYDLSVIPFDQETDRMSELYLMTPLDKIKMPAASPFRMYSIDGRPVTPRRLHEEALPDGEVGPGIYLFGNRKVVLLPL